MKKNKCEIEMKNNFFKGRKKIVIKGACSSSYVEAFFRKRNLSIGDVNLIKAEA